MLFLTSDSLKGMFISWNVSLAAFRMVGTLSRRVPSRSKSNALYFMSNLV